MTRDEAKKYYLENTFLYGYSDDVNNDIEGTVECVINGIYDSFENKSCNWYQQEGGHYFESDCGMQFTIFEGMPSENNMNFCTKCGKKLIEHKHDDY